MKHRTGHLFKRGKAFYVRWAVNGKVFSKALRNKAGDSITNEREAEDAKTKFMAAFIVGDEVASLESIAARLQGRQAELQRINEELNPSPRVVDAWRAFLAAPNRPDTGDSTLRQYAFQFGAFASWLTENHKDRETLSDVTTNVANDYAAHLLESGLTANTYNKHLNLLALVFRVLKDRARLVANPWEDIQRKRVAAQGRRELTIDELRQACSSAEGELRILLATGVYTGMRLGDCATLRRCEVDLPRGMIRRIPNKTARRSPKPVCIPIHPELRKLITESFEAKVKSEYVLPEMAAIYTERRDVVTDLVQAHFKACGIGLHKPGTGKDGKRAVVEVGFHSLRHTFVSLCRDSNAPLAVVESIVGHSNPAMTRHYTHVGELAAGQAVASLPSLLSPADAAPVLSILDRLTTILAGMTAEDWQTRRAEALELIRASKP